MSNKFYQGGWKILGGFAIPSYGPDDSYTFKERRVKMFKVCRLDFAGAG